MSAFLQNFHLSPGQTIRPSRGFKWNNKQQQEFDLENNNNNNSNINEVNVPTFSTPTKNNNNSNLQYPPNTPANNNTNKLLFTNGSNSNSNNNNNNSNNVVTDFNYTPTHQLPFIKPAASTQVTSHRDLKKIVETTLNSESVLEQAVKLPKGEDLNEWIAVHCVDFYNHVNMLYGTITEFCSPTSCPKMIATNEYEYLWNLYPGKPPVSVSAPKYVECLMQWCQNFFDDENIFPVKENVPFPPQFVGRYCRQILKRLFRVYAHIYCHHFNEIFEMNLQILLNTSFRHFCLFTRNFGLLTDEDYGPLLELVNDLTSK
ncbi:related to DBF2 kinase activator protein MOB1 [Saccharomycodes ludwigii]|uniref:Related to DBF2 kinase activator protein MOB1 n=1 Tax=Saccharomycodes ludwigii TaxID=36035 RepID=A0A376BB50_9ASCO|nr:hypothetical protein SCDLUD_002777 [Saccharomycodes ludwigii]KAH3901286.1 hypothetical protein SCDLUD_002777 [Saccharomycodes ludwigii]SSD61902.1 related to DBF2 kinase activator protein MOB1 [Saccharomycodes ludwigii]